MSENGKIPEVSIDEALQLFLAITCPNGIPEGEEGERLISALKEKIASDRPAWAEASEQANQATAQSGNQPHGAPARGYSAVKADIVQQAQQEPLPEDPNERYFYQRDKDARDNREQRKLEAREQRIRDDLFKRLQAQKQGTHETSLQRTLQIRQLLESRLRQSLPLNKPVMENKPGLGHEKLGYSTGISGIPALQQNPSHAQPFSLSAGNNGPDSANGLSLEAPSDKPSIAKTRDLHELDRETLKDLDTEDKLELLRDYARSKRSRLASREELLGSRCSVKAESAFSLDDKDNKNSMALSLDGGGQSAHANGLEFSTRRGTKSRGMKME